MKIALVGFPGSGKSTCFKAIVQKTREEAHLLDPTKVHVETVKIPDERLENLASIIKPKKTTHAELVLEDLPGFHIPAIKDVEAIIEVVGIFSGRDPIKDIENMDVEFLVADFEIVQKRLGVLDREMKQTPSKERELEKGVLERCKDLLEKDTPLRYLGLNENEERLIRGYQFLSRKPLIILGNIGEHQINNDIVKKVNDYCLKKKLKAVEFCAEIEAEIADLEEAEKKTFFKEYNIEKPSRDNVIRTVYSELDLITFFTTKGEETKAWLAERGTPCIEAAGKIHSDIKRGFIKAEVIRYGDLLKAGSVHEAKSAGALKLEGKDYIVSDGDVIDFKFNV